MFQNLAATCPGLDVALQAQIDDVILREDPSHLPARQRLVRRLLDQGELDRALTSLRESARLAPNDLRTKQLLADAYLRAGRPADALAALAHVVAEATDDAVGVVKLRIRALAAMNDEPGFEAQIDELRALTGSDPRTLAAALSFIANVEARRQNLASAIRYENEAYRSFPSEAAMLSVARLSERLGDLSRAYRAYGEACRTYGTRASCVASDRLLETLRERSMQSAQPTPTDDATP